MSKQKGEEIKVSKDCGEKKEGSKPGRTKEGSKHQKGVKAKEEWKPKGSKHFEEVKALSGGQSSIEVLSLRGQSSIHGEKKEGSKQV